jgi:propionyl-CoA carboxylase alpha chain
VIRNDTGVTEGSEISMFYDPMIAKLCTWAPTRLDAIEAMSDALDSFVVDGIEHNIPFLSALMQHPRWREGRLSTGFIAEEYPDGFAPTVPNEDEKGVLAAIGVAVELLRRDRLDRLTGRLGPHSGALKRDWEVRIGDEYIRVSITEGMISIPMEADLSISCAAPLTVSSEWRPGEAVWHGTVGGKDVSAQVRPLLNGIRIAWKGMAVVARPMLPRVAELDRLMPVKLPPDTSKMLLCPMPGLVVSVAVAEGQEVKAGETLAVVEAMKMENVLRAERDVTVGKINAKPGDSLAVDAVIMEFA